MKSPVLCVFTVLVICLALVCGGVQGQTHGLLHAGHRRLSGVPESFTTSQLSYLVSSEIGHRTRAIPDDFIRENQELMKLTSSLFDKPKLVVLGFLPSNGQALPSGVFDDSVSPFTIDSSESTHNCANDDLKCLRDSILKFPLDKQSELVMIDQGVEFVQWAGEPQDKKNMDVAKEMIDAIKSALEADDSDVEAQLLTLSKIPSVPQITINTESQSFAITSGQDNVPFQFTDTCVRALVAEASGLKALQERIGDLTSPEAGAQVLILSPTRALRCFTETKASPLQISAAQHLLLKLIELIITSAEESADGKVFALIGFNSDSNVSSPSQNDVASVHSAAHDDENKVSILDKEDFQAASMIEVAARRRLQNTTTHSKAPRMVVLWLCIVLAFVLVFSIIPLLGLSMLNDPVISTKLFTSAHGH